MLELHSARQENVEIAPDRYVGLIGGIADAVSSCAASETDLEVSLRAHSRDLRFRDTIYIELTVVNRGKDAVTAPEPPFETSVTSDAVKGLSPSGSTSFPSTPTAGICIDDNFTGR
jgi:hypothetical protein